LAPMMMPRHGLAGAVIGNEFHLVSGMIQSAGAMTFFDPHLETHTAAQGVLELNFFKQPPPGKKAEPGAPAGNGATTSSNGATPPSNGGTTSSEGARRS